MPVVQIGLILLLSYLAGSIPTSIIIGRLFFGKDLREYGSGNAGGTNAFRVYGWRGGIPTMIVDVGKGVIATLLVSRLPAPPAVPHEILQIAAGSAAVVGHIWTVFAGFRGGKGVGTAAGMVASLYPIALLFSLPLFAVVLLVGGYVSLASMAAAVSFPFLLLAIDAAGIQEVSPILFWFSIPLALLIVFTHRSNIRRLAAGTENRVEKLMVFSRLRERAARQAPAPPPLRLDPPAASPRPTPRRRGRPS
jgi:glycerol-3-phosphate acyltransferase PlsY